MDNNLNTNGTGIPNVNDIKVEETPAESFENLYGNNAGATPVQNNTQPVGTNNIGMQPNPSMNQSIPNPIPNNPQSVQPNSMTMQPNPNMNQSIPNSTPNNPQPVQPNNMGVQPNLNMNQTVVNPVPNNVQPVGQNNIKMQPNPSINQTVVNPVPNPQQIGPNPNMSQNMEIQLQDNIAPMTPNPGVIMTPNTNINNSADLSNVNIDKQRMQSIEEQLSKTSQYNPEDLQQEKITIPSDNQYEKNKSGLAFVIVLFIILAVVIAFLPQITKWIR